MHKIIILFLLLLSSLQADACTSVFWNNNKVANVAARSMDLFISDEPRLIIFPRGMNRTGDAGTNALTWTSKYGSVAVSAFNTNAISDGMNEHGLAVHLLYLSNTQYPKRNPQLPTISNVLWAQYILDNFKTVSEALAATTKLQIVATEVHGQKWPIHLTMQDVTGDSAIIEYINGHIKIYHGTQFQVMTNEPAYSVQLANLKRYQHFGGKLPLPGDPDPLSRFVRASAFLKTLPLPKSELEALAGVLSVIRTAMVPFGATDTSGNKTEDAWPTRWVTLADVTHKIYYFNSTSTPNIVWLDFNNLNFTAGSPVLSIDPTMITLVGEISKELKPHT